MTIDKNTLGRDYQGRPYGGAALRLLLDAARENGFGTDPYVNLWDVADTVAENADPEVVLHAARYLLGLHLFRLEGKHPQVAMRNIKPGMVVNVGGVPHIVDEVVNGGKPTISLKGRMQHRQWDEPRIFCAYDRDIELDYLGLATD